MMIVAPAAAQMEAPAACPAPVAPPAEMAGWAGRTPLAAATKPGGLSKAMLTVGQGIDAALSPTGKLSYVAPPEKPGGSDDHGGLFGVAITEAGTYRVAMGAGAWVDMLSDGKAIASSAHGHGPACTGIRKFVDFTLTPGRYVLQVAGNAGPTLPLLLTRLP